MLKSKVSKKQVEKMEQKEMPALNGHTGSSHEDSVSVDSVSLNAPTSLLSSDTIAAPNLEKPLKKKLKALYKMQDELPQLVDDASLPKLRLDEQYVDLYIRFNSKKGMEEKHPVKLEQILDEIEGQEATDKVLITGNAGTGKTTLLQHISYLWGQGKIFTDKEYLFVIKLQRLTTDDWRSRPISLNNPVAELVYDSLFEQKFSLEYSRDEELEEISKQEVIDTLRNEGKSILFLLDGYDEAAQLVKPNSPSPIVPRIITEILKFPNVVVTSRPNSLSTQMADKFPRKIEIAGFDQNSILEYIHKYFNYQLSLHSADEEQKKHCQETKEAVLKLYEINPSLREILVTPINTLMVCLISNDPSFGKKFAGDFNIGLLYEEMILWLGKRYVTKFQGKDVNDLTLERIYHLDELKILVQVAYEAFKRNKVAIEGEFIDHYACQVGPTIKDVYKLGLLRADSSNNNNDLTRQNHKFIHLSFQEYLTAHLLKQRLLDSDEQIMREAVKFIAHHRNEPKYLMTLKFLAGLVSNHQQESTDEHQVNQEKLLVTRFWEAVTCNVDGVLELGIESKVFLLMHLLAQARVQGRLDPRIPNLDRMNQLIDLIVLKDITQWGEQIKLSGYLSENMKNSLLEMLDGDFNTSPKRLNQIHHTFFNDSVPITKPSSEVGSDINQAKRVIFLVSQLADKLGATEIFNKLISKYLSAETADFLRPIGDEDERQLRDFFRFITNKNTSDNTIDQTDKIDWQIRKAAFNAIIELTRIVEIATDKIILIIEKFLKFIHIDNLAEKALGAIEELIKKAQDIHITSEVIEKLSSLLSSHNNEIAYSAAKAIGKIAQSGGTEVINIAKKKLSSLMASYTSNNSINISILTDNDDGENGIQIVPFRESLPAWQNPNADNNIYSPVFTRRKIISTKEVGPGKLASIIVKELSALQDNTQEDVVSNIDRAINKLTPKGGARLERASIDLTRLTYMLDSIAELNLSKDEAKSIGELVKNSSITPTQLESVVRGQLLPLLDNNEDNIVFNATYVIGRLAKSEKISAVLALNIISRLSTLLDSINNEVVYIAANVIGKLVKNGSEDLQLNSEIISKLLTLLDSSNSNIINNVGYALGAISTSKKMDSKLVLNIIDKLTAMLSNRDISIISSAAYVISKFASSNVVDEELALEVIKKLFPLLGNSDTTLVYKAAYAIGKFAEGRAEEVACTAIEKLSPLLASTTTEIVSHIAYIINQVAESNGGKAASLAIEKLAVLLDNSNNAVACKLIPSLGKHIESAAIELQIAIGTIKKMLIFLNSDDTNTVYSTAETIGKLVQNGGENTAQLANTTVEALVPLLDNPNIAYSVAYTIGKVAKSGGINANLSIETINRLYLLLSDNKDYTTTSCAAYAIGKIAQGRIADGVVGAIALEKLLTLLNAGYDVPAFSAACTLAHISQNIVIEPEIASIAIGKLSVSLGSEHGNTIKSAEEAIGKLIATLPIELAVAEFDKMHDYQRGKKICVEELLNKLTALLKSLDAAKIAPTIKSMLCVINAMSGTDYLEKECKEVAQKILDKQISLIDNNVMKEEMLLELNPCFAKLTESTTPIIKRLMATICHKLLSNGVMSDVGSEFMVHCIKNGLTTTVTRDAKITLEEATYQLEDKLENKKPLKKITEAAVLQPVLLARQYTENSSLFVNSGAGMDKAAADMPAYSIVTGEKIVKDKWKISLMHLSDHQKQLPNKVLILLERRNEFGDHLTYKVYFEESKLICKFYGDKHPKAMQDAGFLTEIFGPMEYINTKPRYYGSILEAAREVGEALIERVQAGNVNINDNEYNVLHQLVRVCMPNASYLGSSWDMYTRETSPREFTKDSLLKVDKPMVRRDSVRIETQAKVERHEEEFEMLQRLPKDLYAKMQEMRAQIQNNGKINQKDKEIIESKIRNILDSLEKLANKQDVEAIIEGVSDLIDKVEFTEDSLKALEIKLKKITDSHTENLIKVVSGLSNDLGVKACIDISDIGADLSILGSTQQPSTHCE